MKYYKYCPKCGKIETISIDKCSFCKTEFIETDIEYVLNDWSSNKQQITHQIYDKYKIKENPLYDITLAEKREKRYAETHKRGLAPPTHSTQKVTCPYCKSTNVKKISTTSRVVSTGLFGLASKKIGKQFHCNGCGLDF